MIIRSEFMDYTEEMSPLSTKKSKSLLIASVIGTVVLLGALFWFIFAGIKIIFPDYIAGNTIIKADGKYIYTDNKSIFFYGNINDEPKKIIDADCDSTLLSNGRTVYYVTKGDICSVELNGEKQKTIRASEHNVTLVHRYHDLLYFISDKENTDAYYLYQIDLKTGEETEIEGFESHSPKFYVFEDKLYYYAYPMNESRVVMRFNFHDKEICEYLADANIYCRRGYGEPPYLCGYDNNGKTDINDVCDASLYKVSGKEPEKLCDLPENVYVSCIPSHGEKILISSSENQSDNDYRVTLSLFNYKTSEKTDLITDTGKSGFTLQDWQHPEQMYLCYYEYVDKKDLNNTDIKITAVYLIKDDKLNECTIEGDSFTSNENHITIIDGNILDNEFKPHKLTVKEDGN